MADHSRFDALRQSRSELENHYIDEMLAGRMSRRQFMRKGAVIGMSTGLMGAILAACGGANQTGAVASSATTSSSAAVKGATINLAIQTPAASINPMTISDPGGLCLIGQVGEFLTFDNNVSLTLEPQLATSWKPSRGGQTWTFALRRGVTFHDGRSLTADDVVYTFKQLSDTKNASNALSNLGGVLSPSGVEKVDSHTVAFHLDSANGNFPYLVSSDNYNAIIVPAGTDYAHYERDWVGTGPFKLKHYAQSQQAQFVANPDYWGGKPHLEATTFTFYQSAQPQFVALQGGQVDGIVLMSITGAQSILSSSRYTISKLKSSIHRELSMRCDRAPFTDRRVRQAVALAFQRPQMVTALLQGYGQLGNDSPFAPKFRSTDTAVPQRTENVARAKALLREAGHPNGFSATITTEQYAEVPQLAQVMAQELKAIGLDITLKVESQSAYYGKATFGNSDWLDATMSLVDYGDRGVPNVFLQSALTSKGTWNAAHFRDPAYDKLVEQYVAAVDLHSQRKLAGQIEELLLDQTPIAIPYFNEAVTTTTTDYTGIVPGANGSINLARAAKTA